MAKRYRVTLTPEERSELEQMISRGKSDARKLGHARVLLQADESDGAPARTDVQVADALDVSTRTVERVRQRFVEQGLDAALLPKPTARVYERKLDGEQEARLLAARAVELEITDSLSHETVRQTLKKTRSSRT